MTIILVTIIILTEVESRVLVRKVVDAFVDTFAVNRLEVWDQIPDTEVSSFTTGDALDKSDELK
jgi:hypothetical protein